MPTVKKRINVSLPTDLTIVLDRLADRDEVPHATKAAELIRRAIEIEEDEMLDACAQERDRKKVKFLSHKKAWA